VQNTEDDLGLQRIEIEEAYYPEEGMMMEGLYDLKYDDKSRWVRLFSLRDKGVALCNFKEGLGMNNDDEYPDPKFYPAEEFKRMHPSKPISSVPSS
jgi:hypothetical protein